MYQVIQMKGDNEPWWFFEDWQADILTTETYETFEQAIAAYQTDYQALAARYPQTKTKKKYLVAFWDPREVAFCEDCDEDLQQYHGLLLLKEGQVIEEVPTDAGSTNQVEPLKRKACYLRPVKKNR